MRHRVQTLAAQRSTTQVTEQGCGGCIRHFGHQSGRRLWHIALDAPRTQAQGVVQRVESTATEPTIKVRPFKCYCTHHSLDAAMDRVAGLQEGLTSGTAGVLSTLFALMGVLDNRLSQAARERLTQRPDRLGHFGHGRLGLPQALLQDIKPLVKARMELVA
jgi:hypothetical protein